MSIWYVIYRWGLWIGTYSICGFGPGLLFSVSGHWKVWLGGLAVLFLPMVAYILPIWLKVGVGGGLYAALLAHPYFGFMEFGWAASAIGFAWGRHRLAQLGRR